ncbi:MAG: hypothetical protein ACMVO3_11180 [Thalassobaculum sp.]
MVAEPAAQRLVQQVRGRMVGAKPVAPARIDREFDRVADIDDLFLDRGDVDDARRRASSGCR